MRLRLSLLCLPLLLTSLAWAQTAALKPTPTTRPVLLKPSPDNLADLRALQTQVEAVVTKVTPAVVGLRVERGQGSGVIISDDGYVLTAGHVASRPNVDVRVVLADGKTVRGKTLGVNHAIDSGLIKITDPPPGGGKWPFVQMGFSGQLYKAQWCIALGHPGGFKLGRSAPLRLGRILDTRGTFIRTDCTLVGGDSGGPLFDLDGKVVGIHSRIGSTVNDNLHVPVDTFRDTWERLAKGDEWGEPMFRAKPYFGIEEDDMATNCRVGDVFPGSPAEKAGLKTGDVITSFGGQKVENFSALVLLLAGRKVGEEVTVQILRDDKPVTVKVVIAARPR
jgi:serine protease Do